ncbi:MAG: hypothetical protein HWD86_09745 [Kangiellaceae bacterium]|nr:hypothetical protein [Kangiellaceae bacterium]
MTKNVTTEQTQLIVDWSAVLWSGFLAAVLTLPVLFFIFPYAVNTDTNTIIQYWSSLLLGVSVITIPASFSVSLALVACVVHIILTLVLTAFIASVFHRWGLVIGIAGGALVGLCYYAINIYSVTYFFNWMFQLEGIWFLLFNLFTGALAGGLYEALEREQWSDKKSAQLRGLPH